jgi:hypothetical protein
MPKIIDWYRFCIGKIKNKKPLIFLFLFLRARSRLQHSIVRDFLHPRLRRTPSRRRSCPSVHTAVYTRRRCILSHGPLSICVDAALLPSCRDSDACSLRERGELGFLET